MKDNLSFNFTEGDLIEFIEKGGELDKLSVELQLKVVRLDGNYIHYIKHPSLEVQLEAVREKASAIRFIKNPAIEVQLEVVRKRGQSVVWLDLKNFFDFPYELKEKVFKYRNSLTLVNKTHLKNIENYLIRIGDAEYKKIMIKANLEGETYHE